MRARVLALPAEPGCTHLERQSMLGDGLLVAPVVTAQGEVAYSVPAGTWTHMLTGERVQGPRWMRESHDFFSLPLLARPGSVIPFGATAHRPDYDYADGVTLRVFEPVDGGRVVTTVPAPDGLSAAVFTTSRSGSRIRVEAVGAPAGWRVQLVGVHEASADGGVAIRDELGVIV